MTENNTVINITDPIYEINEGLLMYDGSIQSKEANSIMGKIYYSKKDELHDENRYYAAIIPYNKSIEYENNNEKHILNPSIYETAKVLIEKSNNYSDKLLKKIAYEDNSYEKMKIAALMLSTKYNTTIPKGLQLTNKYSLKTQNAKIFQKKIDTANANTITVEFYYNKGGKNPFTLINEQRGYYLSIYPETVKNKDTYLTSTYQAYTGIKQLIAPAKKYNETIFNNLLNNTSTRNKAIEMMSVLKTKLSPEKVTNQKELNFQEQLSKLITDTLKANNTNLEKETFFIKKYNPNISNQELNTYLISALYNNIISNDIQKYNMEELLKNNNLPVYKNTVVPYIQKFITDYKSLTLESSFFKNSGTIIELNNYFARILQKGDSYGKTARWEHDEPGVQFLFKQQNMNIQKYNLLNHEGKSFYACKNNQFLESTPATYFLSTLIEKKPSNSDFIIMNGYQPVSSNEHHHLYHTLKELNNQKHDSNKDNYIALHDTPCKEIVIDPKKMINDEKYTVNILFNNEVKKPNTIIPLTSKDFEDKGYKVITLPEYKRQCEQFKANKENKWIEISKGLYDAVINNSKKLKSNMDGTFINEKVFENYYHYYTKRIEDRYFTSIQNINKNPLSIEDNLIAHKSRALPLSQHLENIENVFKTIPSSEYNQDENSKIKYIHKESIAQILKNAGAELISEPVSSNGHHLTGFIYKYNPDDQRVLFKSSSNKYDQFAVSYLLKTICSDKSTQDTIQKALSEISIKGEGIPYFSNELANNKNNQKYINKLLENLFLDNTTTFDISRPTLQEISQYAAKNLLDISSPKEIIQKSNKITTTRSKSERKV